MIINSSSTIAQQSNHLTMAEKLHHNVCKTKTIKKQLIYLATSFQMDGAIIQGLGTHL